MISDFKKKLNQQALYYLEQLNKSGENFKNALLSNDEESIISCEKTFWNTFVGTSNRMHVALDDLCLRQSYHVQKQIYLDLADINNIQVKAHKGMLLICCPHPPHRRADYFKEFRYILASAIDDILGDLELYPQKTLYIINIYPKSSMRSTQFLDFDNYDLKSLIDEACQIYPETDSPATTNMYLQTIFNDELPPLTYLVVTPQVTKPDITELLKTVFGTPAPDTDRPADTGL